MRQDAEQGEAALGGDDVLAAGGQQILAPQSLDDLGAGGGGADALGLLQAFAVFGVLDEAPGVHHRLDQRALAVARRGFGFLRLHSGFAEDGGFSVAQGRQDLLIVFPLAVETSAAGALAARTIPVEALGGVPAAA